MAMTPEEKMAAAIGAAASIVDDAAADTDRVVATEAQAAERVVSAVERNKIRLLVVTEDIAVYEDGSAPQLYIQNLSELFAEVHVLVLNHKKEALLEQVRLADNIWLYPTNSPFNRRRKRDGLRVVSEALVFANGFRADIILALDPFVSGAVASELSQLYDAPLQLHLFKNIFDPAYQATQKKWSAKEQQIDSFFSVQPRVLVANAATAEAITERYALPEGYVQTIAPFVDLAAIKEYEGQDELKKRFPQYSLFVLYAGPLSEEGGVLEAFTAARAVLRYPTAAFVVLGEGPLEGELMQRAEAMGMREQVIINPPGVSEPEVYTGVHFVIVPKATTQSEAVLMKSAAAGAPIVATASAFAAEMFEDGQSALLCSSGDAMCFRSALTKLLNDPALRKRLSREARQDIFERVTLDRDTYRAMEQQAIEQVLFNAQEQASTESETEGVGG